MSRYRNEYKTPWKVRIVAFLFACIWTFALFYLCFGILQPKLTDAIKGYAVLVNS